MSIDFDYDIDRIAEVAARLDLRPPNRDALQDFVFARADHIERGRSAPFECVIDSATGVGKTYIAAGIIEYLGAADFVRNFAIICPNRTILNKTVANFTPGHTKSLLGSMDSRPLMVTAENFDAASTRSAMDDDTQVKIYVFTVQSLIKPTTKAARRTREFQEGLGAGFYDHLSELDDLVVIADEHHLYFGPSFSDAVSGLKPHAVVGLTATPDPKTPESQIIHRYPLSAAIADQWVKTPVIVGRRDDRKDALTKLLDGVTLLRYKAEVVDSYVAENGLPPLNPVMLVIAKDTGEANEFSEILSSSEFDNGNWTGTILTVHSKLNGEDLESALAELAAVEDPTSSVRIIISVGMLKEGWDVKNVYVIAAMRALASKVLTEQTLGRGLRLPFGKYTGIELLDTLEIVAHEKYEDLLRIKGILNEQFVDRRTRAVLQKNAQGETVVTFETEMVSAHLFDEAQSAVGVVGGEDKTLVAGEAPLRTVASFEERSVVAGEQADDLDLEVEYLPHAEMQYVLLPRLAMSKVEVQFSLADITNLAPFRALGQQLAASPESELQRVKVSARIITGRDGLRRTELVTATTVDRLEASDQRLPLDNSIALLIDIILGAPVVPTRPDQAKAVRPIVDAFLEGLGSDAEHLLSAYGERAAGRLVRLVTDEHRQHLSAPRYDEVIELTRVGGPRRSKRKVSLDPTEPYKRTMAYDSWQKGAYTADWFDSSTERALAVIVDASAEVKRWIRLQTGDFGVLWRSDNRTYNADFVIVENSDDHWVVEVKADKEVTSDEVQAKRRAALRWVNHVNAAPNVDARWHYLLLAETDISESKGSWSALKAFGA